jgi:SAM-dependent methyltransferase
LALGRDIVDAIIREHAYRAMSGDVLLIGRQTVRPTRRELAEMLADHGIAAGGFDGPDGGDAAGTAPAFFRRLGASSCHMLVERATDPGEIEHDLAAPLPAPLAGSADVVIDAGVLADRFDPALALRAYAGLLRPGGRLIAINSLSRDFDPYSIPSPLWYLDYFVTNGFADCKAYVIVYFPESPFNAFCVDIDSLLDPARTVRSFRAPYEMAALVVAEKDAGSTVDLTPTHLHLRSAAEWERYRRNLARMKLSPRPHLVRSRGEMRYFDVVGGHLFMRSDYAAVDPSTEARRVRGPQAGADGAEPPRPAGLEEEQAPRQGSALRVLCVGTGRDGTQSLCHMIARVLEGAGGGRVMHEYCCREMYQAFSEQMETGEHAHTLALERMIADCPYECIVGNGYAAVLPLFAAHYGRGLKIVHLRRADRAACIASLKKNCELFPAAYGYYSSSPDAVVKRMTAFHFGEMSRSDWEALSIDDKFGWYYDKTHALVGQYRTLFDDYLEVTTESLDDEEVRGRIARFVAGSDAVVPPRAHLNAAAIDIASFPREYQHKMHWLMGRLNLEEVARDDVYALDYFLEKFVAWTGYQITDAPQLAPARPAPPGQLAENLERAVATVKDRLREIESLRALLRERQRGSEP